MLLSFLIPTMILAGIVIFVGIKIGH
jgi:hypothetical protein